MLTHFNCPLESPRIDSVQKPVQYEIKVQSMCGILPCVQTRLETRTDESIKSVIEYVNKPACCMGYAEVSGGRCAPICSDPCGPGGKCVKPDVCKCQPEPGLLAPGFSGLTCRRFTCLDTNRWGASCERVCPSECSQNSYCSADTGKCVCEPGWHGPNCSVECGPDDSLESGCNFISQMPPIIEPDANLLAAANDNNLSLSRTQKAEALILSDDGRDDVKMTSNDAAHAWPASNYLLVVLSALTIVLLVAALVLKKRYDALRNKVDYACVSSVGSRSTGHSGTSSDYSASTYYSAGRAAPPLPMPGLLELPAKNLDSNLNFAAATRNILSGEALGQDGAKKVLVLSPKTEAHLIRSQKASKQNIYSEVDISNRSRIPTPTLARHQEDDDGDHIYQVPKRSPNTSTDISMVGDEPKPNDISLELGDDHDDDNIYEEIKPKKFNGHQ
jgi:hypothetical protein